MTSFRLLWLASLSGFFVSCCCQTLHLLPSPSASSATGLRTFLVKGIVKKLKPDEQIAIIQHETISNYMVSMTMPFKVKNPAELRGLQTGDEISFRLMVTEEQSWIDRICRTARKTLSFPQSNLTTSNQGPPVADHHPLLDYQFTNELGQAVSLSRFKGEALAITFLFTRCPIPDYCPRLSKNFEEASKKLASLPDAPANWHFLSVSFDTDFDSPAVLKAYAERYHYDPKHWSFLTGPREKIAELARLSGVTIESEGAFFNHSFRTLIIDAAGQLQMSFPIGGNLSDALVAEILKAAASK